MEHTHTQRHRQTNTRHYQIITTKLNKIFENNNNKKIFNGTQAKMIIILTRFCITDESNMKFHLFYLLFIVIFLFLQNNHLHCTIIFEG